jgi:hypothetical protein
MMDALRIKPANGAHVRDPRDASVLPTEGRVVPLTQYWRRRLAEGSVVTVSARDDRIAERAVKSDKSNDKPSSKGDTK